MLRFSYLRALMTGNYHISGLPASVSLEPVNFCNLHCPECPAGKKELTRETGELSLETYTKVVDQLHTNLISILLYFQGEPYLHKNLFEMIRYARKYKIYVLTSTNGQFLTSVNARKTVESGLNKLIISVDGTTQETYEQYRINGKLSKVTEGIRQLAYWKKKLGKRTPVLEGQFLVFSHNEHQRQEFRKLGKEWGLNRVVFKSAQFYEPQNMQHMSPSASKYIRYKGGKELQLRRKIRNRCFRMWHSGVMTREGSWVPCCFDKDAKYVLGNMDTSSLQEIWFSKEYETFRKSVLSDRNSISMCANCTE